MNIWKCLIYICMHIHFYFDIMMRVWMLLNQFTNRLINFYLKKFNILIERRNMVDNTLDALGVKTEYQTTYRNVMHIVTIWIIGSILMVIIIIEWTYDISIGYGALVCMNLVVNFPILINSVVDVTFISFVRQVS